MKDFLEEVDELADDLFLQRFGESVPDFSG